MAVTRVHPSAMGASSCELVSQLMNGSRLLGHVVSVAKALFASINFETSVSIGQDMNVRILQGNRDSKLLDELSAGYAAMVERMPPPQTITESRQWILDYIQNMSQELLDAIFPDYIWPVDDNAKAIARAELTALIQTRCSYGIQVPEAQQIFLKNDSAEIKDLQQEMAEASGKIFPGLHPDASWFALQDLLQFIKELDEHTEMSQLSHGVLKIIALIEDFTQAMRLNTSALNVTSTREKLKAFMVLTRAFHFFWCVLGINSNTLDTALVAKVSYEMSTVSYYSRTFNIPIQETCISGLQRIRECVAARIFQGMEPVARPAYSNGIPFFPLLMRLLENNLITGATPSQDVLYPSMQGVMESITEMTRGLEQGIPMAMLLLLNAMPQACLEWNIPEILMVLQLIMRWHQHKMSS